MKAGWGGRVYAAGAASLIAAYPLLPEGGWWRTLWQVGVGYLAAAAVLLGVRRLPLAMRVPWWCFAAGVAGNATGIFQDAYLVSVAHSDSAPSAADIWWLSLYAFVGLGLCILIRRRNPVRDWAALVDALTITTGVGLLAWVFVIQPASHDTTMSLAGRWVGVAYPIGDLVMLGLMVRLMRGGGSRGWSFWLISASLLTFLVGDTTWALFDNLSYTPTGMLQRLVEMVFLVAYSLFGVAALHGSGRDLGQPAAPRPPRLSALQLALLTVVSMLAPALLIGEVYHGVVSHGTAIAVGSASLFLLVVARMAQLLKQVEQQAGKVRELSRRDELTGLPNRRAWNDELPRALERSRRDAVPTWVALLDLDHFKQFNDAYGHPAGDRLLKAAAAAWSERLRSVDLVCRYGGEEFIVLLPGLAVGDVADILTRVKAATPLGQTFSAGVAMWDGRETSDELIARADVALYAAKADGRNQIRTAEAAEPSGPASVPAHTIVG